VADKEFDLGDYVEVKDRIARFYDLFGQGRLVTENYTLTNEPDGKPKVIVTAAAYRTPDDPHPAIGHSWMYLPGTTSYTRGSELENVETSAWGRAIGALGILIDRSIASANEVRDKSGPAVPQTASAVGTTASKPDPLAPVFEGPLTVTGAIVVKRTAPADGLLRETPDGPALCFAFEDTDGKGIPQVVVRGHLAVDVIDSAGDSLAGMVCTLSGDLYRVPWVKEGRDMRPYQRLELHRIETAGWTLPIPEVEGQTDLFHELTPDDEAELDALAEGLK